MALRNSIAIIFLGVVFVGCTREFDCSDLQIQPGFIGFIASDIDTFVVRKFKPNDNYRNLIDTFMVKYGYNGSYKIAHDTTTVFINDGVNGVKSGYDWQIFIPAKNKTVLISEIMSEKKTGKCNSGIFSMDKAGCTCINNVFSIKQDGNLVNFSSSTPERNGIFIRN